MNNPSININSVDIEWDTEKGTFTFFGIPSALFWINPSLMTMLKPLAEEVGFELFRLQIASSASQGTEEDYHNMVTVLGDNFEEGFLKWGAAVSSAGWGTFEILKFDEEGQQATVKIRNTWELLLQKDLPDQWGCPFIQGKIIGIFSHALKTNCWAKETQISFDAEDPYVIFDIYKSDKTISTEIEKSRIAHMQEKEKQLALEVQKKTVELNEATLKAQAASFAKSKFMASMSHELRTPLNAVIGMSQLLQRDKKNNLNDSQKEQVDHILDAGRNMLSLVNQVLSFSEVSIDNSDTVTETINIQTVIQQCLELTAPLAKRRSISIEQLSKCPCAIIGNTEYIKEILLVMITNACTYIPEGGIVMIQCKKDDEGFARISVIDNGPGIPADKKDKIFEPFDRLEQTTGAISGAGVGLPIAKLMTGVMGGNIGYEDNSPQGSIFWVALPTA